MNKNTKNLIIKHITENLTVLDQFQLEPDNNIVRRDIEESVYTKAYFNFDKKKSPLSTIEIGTFNSLFLACGDVLIRAHYEGDGQIFGSIENLGKLAH